MPMALRLSRTRVPLALLSCAALTTSACGDDDPIVTPDAEVDVGADTPADADVGVDATTDVEADTAPDAEPDAVPDATPDAEVDATPDAEPDAEPGPIEVVGEYDDGFGGFVRVTDSTVAYSWYGDDIAITAYDNASGWIVGQNSPDDPWSPNLWSRIEWSVTDDGVLWCQTEFAAETEEDAIAGATADREDLETGCSTFPWTVLTPGQGPIAIAGDWTDAWDSVHVIGNESWTQTYPESAVIAFEVAGWDNANEAVFAMNSEENEFFAGDWSRFDWAMVEGTLWYCQTVFDGDDEEAVRAADAADATDPAAGGCGGAPWTQMTPVEAE